METREQQLENDGSRMEVILLKVACTIDEMPPRLVECRGPPFQTVRMHRGEHGTCISVILTTHRFPFSFVERALETAAR
jgi:hypothetical protein